MWEGTTYVSSTVDVLTSRVIFNMFSMLTAQRTYNITLHVPSAMHLVPLAHISSQKPFVIYFSNLPGIYIRALPLPTRNVFL